MSMDRPSTWAVGCGRLAAGLLAAALLGGCTAGTSSPSVASASGLASSAASPSGLASAPSSSGRVEVGPLAVQLPATWDGQPWSWSLRRGSINPSGNVPLAFISPQALPTDCEETPQGGVCHPWPIMTLDPGGMVVAIRQNGMPGSHPPADGQPTSVGGRSARTSTGPADTPCATIGGTESIALAIPATAAMAPWFGIDACLAGPDTASAEMTFSEFLGGLSWSPGS